MAQLKNDIRELIKQFSECTKDPTLFLTNQPNIEKKLKILVKQCYDNSKCFENRSNFPKCTLSKLLICKFDAEQIWQQVELQNKFLCQELDREIKNITSHLRSSQVISNGESENDELISKDEISGNEDEKSSKKVRFALPNEDSDNDSEISQDVKDEDTDSEDVDNDDEREEENNDDIDDDVDNDEKNKNFSSSLPKQIFDDASDDDNEPKSAFEERQERLKKRVEKLEEDLLADKPWQLKGEVTGKKRPENSLLDEHLDFDLSSRPAPIITEEAALKLEDVIKNRIINRVWDDVERKIKPVDTPREFKKKLVLDQEKSKLSLAQVYEQDYVKQRQAVNAESKSKEEEEPKEHKHLRVLLNSLFRKLDALSNYHYTPLPSIPEPQIVTNLPAVTLEEAIPDATSGATLLAPEEVQRKTKGDLVSKEERTTTDKKRARRKKKIKQKLKQREIKLKESTLQKLKPNLKNNFAKEKIKKDLERLLKDKSVSHFREDVLTGKSSKSSQQFFTRLQETITEENNVKKKRKRENINIDPKRIKL